MLNQHREGNWKIRKRKGMVYLLLHFFLLSIISRKIISVLVAIPELLANI
jgi:hypothetical protein